MKSPIPQQKALQIWYFAFAKQHITYIMIIDFNVNYNNYEEKILNFYGFWEYKCPCCGARHSLTRHASYTRNICFLIAIGIEEHKIKILRLVCSSCNTTHAILPADTIPYCIYSFSCILQILTKLFVDEQSVIQISNKNHVSFQLIYLFIKRLIKHYNPCINFLRMFLTVQLDFTSSFKDVLSIITKNFSCIDFQREYINYTKLVFLMIRNQNILSRKVHIGAYFKPPT